MKYLVLICFVLTLQPSCAQPAQTESEYIRANYIKKEFSIAMRDGVKLFTSVYMPKDSSL